MTIGIKTDGSAGFLDLNTTLLHDAQQASTDVAVIAVCDPTWLGSARIWSAEGNENASSPILQCHFSDEDKYRTTWTGTNGASIDIGALAPSAIKAFTVVFELSATSPNGNANAYFVVDNGSAVSDTDFSAPDAPDIVGIRLAAARDNASADIAANFGFFAVLDLGGVATPDAAWSEGLSAAIYNAGIANAWNPEKIRIAIMEYDGLIVGEFWKLDEAANGAAFDSEYVFKYDIATGKNLSLGEELVTNGAFAFDSDWTKGTGWSIGSAVATKTAGTAADLSQANVVAIGTDYLVTFTVSGISGGTVNAALGTSGAGASVSIDGTYSQLITAAGSGTSLAIQGDSSFAGNIDTVSVREFKGFTAPTLTDVVVDGDFSTGATNWDLFGSGVAFTSPGLRFTGDTNVGQCIQGAALWSTNIGQVYRLTYTVSANTLDATGEIFVLGNFPTTALSDVVGTHYLYLVADVSGSTSPVGFHKSATPTSGVYDLDEVVLELVNGGNSSSVGCDGVQIAADEIASGGAGGGYRSRYK